jgi:CheY-like chemotaxis protein
MTKILIVDDNADHTMALARVLEAKGHEVRSAANGREAINQVLSNVPDVVVLDLLMPEMDGASFLEVVRSYVRLQAIPVVVLTGVPESPLVGRTRAARVNAILAKGKARTEDIEKAIHEALVTTN